jgi:hypothetical protein
VLYFSFVIDVYSRMIVGWQLAANMRDTLVLDALRMALGLREHGADVQLVHHSDAGSQLRLNRSSQQRVVHGTVVVRNARAAGGALRSAGDALSWTTRLSSRRLARRAGRSGDSRVRACADPHQPGRIKRVSLLVAAARVSDRR